MKKLIAAALTAAAAITAFSLSGCGYTDALDSASSSSQAAQETTVSTADEAAKNVKASDYEDSFDGLCSYFRDKGYIVENAGDEISDSNVTEMDASLIGASQGKKFATKYNGSSITVELYGYDDTQSDDAKAIIESVKSSGTFTILELSPVTAYLSDSGKYLMIYTDSTIDSENPDETSSNYTHRQEVIEALKGFHS